MILFGLDILLFGLTYFTFKNIFFDENEYEYVTIQVPPTYQQAEDDEDIPPAYF